MTDVPRLPEPPPSQCREGWFDSAFFAAMVGTFVVACALDAWTCDLSAVPGAGATPDLEFAQTLTGESCFFIGALSVSAELPGWLANPLLVVGTALRSVHARGFRVAALVAFVAALLLAATVPLQLTHYHGDRDTTLGERRWNDIVTYGPGFYAWVASMAIGVAWSIRTLRSPSMRRLARGCG